MNWGNTPFLFSDKPHTIATSDDFLLVIPQGILTKQQLLAHYASACSFPSYFGHNWDALEECLGDLSWIRPQRILIVHEDLPLANDDQQCRVYLDILAGAVELWNGDKSHGMLVVFPSTFLAAVSPLVSKNRR